MKHLFYFKWFIALLFILPLMALAQDGNIKIYQSNSGDGACLIVFPSDPEPLMVMTGRGACTVVKTMALDDWHQMSSSTVVTTSVSEAPPEGTSIVSPRDAASGMASGKRQHKPILLSELTLDAVGDNDRVCSFSWGTSNSGSSAMSASAASAKATYDVKSSNKARMAAPAAASTTGESCCSSGTCTVTVMVSKKHTKSGHVTLMK